MRCALCSTYHINNTCDADSHIARVSSKLKLPPIADDAGNIFVNASAMCFVAEVCKNAHIRAHTSRKLGGGGVFELDSRASSTATARGVRNGVGFGAGFGAMGDPTMSRETSA
jgi:hypothetical protein